MNEITTSLPKICVAYAPQDAQYYSHIKKLLEGLENAQKIHSWHTIEMNPGPFLKTPIHDIVETSDIFLAMLSVDFFISETFLELEGALVRRKQVQELVVVPIFVRPCNYELHPIFSRSQGFPKGTWLSEITDYKELTILLREIGMAVVESLRRE